MNTFLTPVESDNTWWFDGRCCVARSPDGELKTVDSDHHANFWLLKDFDEQYGPIIRSANDGEIVWNHDGIYVLLDGQYHLNNPPYPVTGFDCGLVETEESCYYWRNGWIESDLEIDRMEFTGAACIRMHGRQFRVVCGSGYTAFTELHPWTDRVLGNSVHMFEAIAYLRNVGLLLTSDGQVYSPVDGFIDEIRISRAVTKKMATS
jgi:hypothetical protein